VGLSLYADRTLLVGFSGAVCPLHHRRKLAFIRRTKVFFYWLGKQDCAEWLELRAKTRKKNRFTLVGPVKNN